MTPVIVRRKRDGLFLSKPHGFGRIPIFTANPSRLKSRDRAITIIRVDLGQDLDDYEITEAQEKPE